MVDEFADPAVVGTEIHGAIHASRHTAGTAGFPGTRGYSVQTSATCFRRLLNPVHITMHTAMFLYFFTEADQVIKIRYRRIIDQVKVFQPQIICTGYLLLVINFQTFLIAGDQVCPLYPAKPRRLYNGSAPRA